MHYKPGSPFRNKAGDYYRLYLTYMRNMENGCNISHSLKVTDEGIELSAEMKKEFEHRPDAEVRIHDVGPNDRFNLFCPELEKNLSGIQHFKNHN